MTESRRAPSAKISCVITDVDGTLVTHNKVVTPAARAAVAALRKAGIAFSVASSRPPRGLIGLIHALEITNPVVGFDGGLIVKPDLSVIEQHLVNPQIAQRVVQLLTAETALVWVFNGRDWLVQDTSAPQVTREIRTLRFQPTPVRRFDGALDAVGKIVGLSTDEELIAHCAERLREMLADQAEVTNPQLDRVDVTHPLANKGASLLAMAKLLGFPPEEIAVLGDGGNDVAAFEQAGLSIAMGNAQPAVKAAADFVTDSNEDDGLAHAIERIILGGERTSAPRKASRDHARP